MWGLTHKLALSNLLKNRRLYYPFAMVTIVSTALTYIFTSLCFNTGLSKVWGADSVGPVLRLGWIVVMIAVAIILLYANSFVMKNRSKEFGLYSILGLDKKHLLYMTFVEMVVFATGAVGIGLLLGLALDQLFYALLLKMLQVEVVLVNTFRWSVLVVVVLYFLAVFILTSLLNAGKLGLSTSLSLVKGVKTGEKKGRFLWLQTGLGLILLLTAYVMAQQIESPVSAILQFFQAVLLVIAATYLLFNAGIISFLNFLKKRPSYYYQPTNFISVSNLVFRMRKNGVGLATISILSTMFLVTMVGGINVYATGKNVIDQANPNDFVIESSVGRPEEGKPLLTREAAVERAYQMSAELELPDAQVTDYAYRMDFVTEVKGNSLTIDEERLRTAQTAPALLYIISTADYQKMTGRSVTLADDQALLYTSGLDVDEKQPLQINGKRVNIKERLTEDFTLAHIPNTVVQGLTDGLYLVVPDISQYLSSEKETYYTGIDTSMDDLSQAKLRDRFYEASWDTRDNYSSGLMSLSSYAAALYDYLSFAGSILFIGILLSLVFLMATILVIYYKQVSEAYEDRDRFVIMGKVGLDEREASRSIRKQMLTVFFLPIGVALVHFAFAYKMLRLILRLMTGQNDTLVLQVSLSCCVFYFLVYVVVYSLTSKTYRRLIQYA